MRNYVSTVLLGIDTANTSIAQKDLDALTDRQLIAYDADTGIDIKATTKNIAFARGTAVLGEPLLSGVIPISGIESVNLNAYKAAVKQKNTLTVSSVPTVGKTCIIKVIYHDNLSIIPNQIKQTAIALYADAVNTASTTTWAAAIAAEFNKQAPEGKLFVAVTTATNVVTFESLIITTQSNYNGIDRPEAVIFEVGAPTDAGYGVYVVARTVAPSLGQGDAAKMAWMEEKAMGRHGFSDRRLWNDTKKYPGQVVAGETYATLIINANAKVEGDMQGVRYNPIGAILGGESAALTLILVDLAVAGVVPTTIAAG